MSTEQLMEILKVRQACDLNPTSQSLLYELSLALKKLKKYEDTEAEELKKAISAYLTTPHSIE
jgi:histidinol-phosphate/aromatic aminotransferase/cobyric acid decarboxylase-like protein